MIKRAVCFLAGLALGMTVPAAAQQFEIHCQPVALQPCGNALAMHFQTLGHIPNRCKIS